MTKHIQRFLVAGFLCGVLGANLRADSVLLTFEGLTNQQSVGSFYNGGAGGNLGVVFSPNAIVADQTDLSINTFLTPSPNNSLFFLTGAAATLNYAAGFTEGFSFYYSAAFNPGFINVYSGLDGTGTLLARLDLPTTVNGASNPDCQGNNFCPFVPIGVAFSGTARSVDFGGTVNQIAFDNITIGAATPRDICPEPASLVLMLTGLALAAPKLRRLV
jgi:hypothetical protein